MAPLIIPATVQVTINGTLLDRPWTNVLHVLNAADVPINVDATDAIATWFQGWYNAQAPARAASWTVENIIVTDISEAGGFQLEYPLTGLVGTGSGEALSPDSAIVVTWLTSRRGGSFRGRTYLCGFTTLGVDDGRLDTDAFNAEDAAVDAFIADTPEGFFLGVASRTLLDTNAVVAHRINNVFDRQTRRNFVQ